jgi:broad specificity phosphatase PhoE
LYPGHIKHGIIDDARRGYKEGVEWAIADIKRIDSAGCTALHHAASYGFADVTGLLIMSGADVNAKSLNHMTPLHYAIMNGRTETACLLMQTAQCELGIRATHPCSTSPLTCPQLLRHLQRNFDRVHYTVCALMLVKHMTAAGPFVAWIRHAESVANIGRAKKFDTDAVLSDNGRVVARRIGEFAERFKLFEDFDVISSPMVRTLETGRLITAANSSSRADVDHRIGERIISFSDIGTPVPVLAAKYPEYTFTGVPEHWWHCPERNGAIPGCLEPEAKHLLRERVDAFTAELDERVLKSGRNTLVLTHAGVIGYIFNLRPRNCEVCLSRPKDGPTVH